MTIFEKHVDEEVFESVSIEAAARTHTRLLVCRVTRNHTHLVVWPREDGELSRFVGWLTLTHTRRWHAYRQSTGTGHADQGSFRSFPIQEVGRLEHVNAAQTDAELAALRRSVNRGCPYGTESWCDRTIRRLGMESTIRPRGRPNKQQKRC